MPPKRRASTATMGAPGTMGPPRRASNESNRSGGKSYSEIREAYNIPSNNTLPPGVAAGTSSSNGDMPNERDVRNVRGHYNPIRANNFVTANAGMPARNKAGSNSTGNIAGMGMPRRKSFGETMMLASPQGQEGYASDVSTNDKPSRRDRRHHRQPPAPGRTPPGRSDTLPDRGGGRGDTGNKAYKRRSTVDGIPPPPIGLQRPGPGGGAGAGRGGMPQGVSQGRNNSAGRKRGASSAGRRRATVDHSPGPSSDPGAADFKLPGGGSLDHSNNSRQSKQRRRQDGRGGGLKGLKSLPENASFKDSNRFSVFSIIPGQKKKKEVNSMSIEEVLAQDYFQMQKALNAMSVKRLRSELINQGISVDGVKDKTELIGLFSNINPFDAWGEKNKKGKKLKDLNSMSFTSLKEEARQHGIAVEGRGKKDLIKICDKKRTEQARTNSLEGVAGNSKTSGVDRRPTVQGRMRNGRLGRRRQTVDGAPSGAPGRRKTIDEANPQQGFSNASNYSNDANKNPAGSQSFTAPTNPRFAPPSQTSQSFSGPPSRRASSISSSGDPDELVTINAAPGVGPVGFGQDVQHPNQKGQFIQQIHQPEGQAPHVPAQPQAQGGRHLRRNKNEDTIIIGCDEGGFIDASSANKGGTPGNQGLDPPPAEAELPRVHTMRGPPARSAPNARLKKQNYIKDSFCLKSTAVEAAAVNSSLNSGTVLSDNDGSDKAHVTIMQKSAKKKKCCSKKKIIIVVAVALVLAIALTVTLVLVLKGGDEDENRGDDAPLRKNTAPPPPQYPGAPLPDIEGRCSPSNLPGSLPACQAACEPSACCYPNNTNGSCIDENAVQSVDACYRYRPYCDVLYDPWPGAEDGALRSPSQSKDSLCNAISRTEASNTSEPLSESFQRKRLRHATRGDMGRPRRNLSVLTAGESCDHIICKTAQCCHASTQVAGLTLSAGGVYINSTNEEHVVTNCQFGENKELCKEYAKLCNVSSSSNVDNGALTHATGMNPQMSAPKLPKTSPTEAPSPSIMPANDEFLTTNSILMASSTSSSLPTHTSKPSPLQTTSSHPTTSKSPSYNSSRSPNLSSSTISNNISLMPTIQPAPTLEIAASCSGDENAAMISNGVTSARVKCISACQDGLCCFADMLGYGSWMPLCYEGNEGRCLEYVPCLALVKWNEVSTPVIIDVENNADVKNITAGESDASMQSTPTAGVAIDAPPTPSQDLTLICSQESISTSAGLESCLLACEAGSCCVAQEGEGMTSCYSEHPGTCALYQPCMNVVNAPQGKDETTTEEDSLESPPPADQDVPQAPMLEKPPNLPPPASAQLATACSYDSLAASKDECFELCQPGKCCLDSSCLKEDGKFSQAIFDDFDAICEMYRLPCYNLYLLSAPPSYFHETCDRSNNSADECATICSAVSCCFSESSEPTPETLSLRLNTVVRAALCPDAYDPSVASSYKKGTEVEAIGLIFKCNGYPWSFYCTQPKFAPYGEEKMWMDVWREVGPCTAGSLPSNPAFSAIDSSPAPNPTTSLAAQSNDSTTYSKKSPSSCYEHFEETCNEYAPYCAPAIDLPPPPSYLATLCTFSGDFCDEACKVASCCFESLSELNCFDDNKERCEEYSPCQDRKS